MRSRASSDSRATATRSGSRSSLRRAASSPSCSMRRRSASGIFTAETTALLNAAVIVSMALTPLAPLLLKKLLPARTPSLDGIDERRRAHRHGPGHRLRPLRPGGEPGAARPPDRRVDHRFRHGDDPGRGALRLQDLLRRRHAARRAARRRRRQRQDRSPSASTRRSRPTGSSRSSRPSSRSPSCYVRSFDRGHSLRPGRRRASTTRSARPSNRR